jgi:hypothetical protein
LSYESDANPLYYAMRFIDGLCDDIKQMVMIQRPSTLDSACALALVQEEAVDSVRKKESQRYEPFSNRQAHRSGQSLLLPPKLDKHASSSVADDRWSTEASRASGSDTKLLGNQRD